MKAEIAEVGRVAVSLMGHDRGRWYCVTAIPDDLTVLCCDGDLRKLENPKKKQRKHLKALPMTVDLTQKGGSGGRFDNSDLRRELKAMKAAYAAQTGWTPAEKHEEVCALVKE